MSFDRPDLATLIERAEADIETLLPDADATVRRTVLYVLARILAGGLHGLYGYLDWLAVQLFPDTCETTFLDRWASLWGVARTAATTATGSAAFTGTSGSVIPAGTALTRADGAEYVTTAEATLADGQAVAAVAASEAGADGNTGSGTLLTLSSPVEGVNATATAGELAGGADAETDTSLRSRLLARIQQAPHGGADFDYVTWALEVAGVTRAWVYPQELGAGTVTVRFMMDATYSDGIPLEADVAAVQDYIDALRPVTVDLWVVAPTPVALNPTIKLSPNTAAVRAAVEAELADLIMREAEPGGTVLISHLREAVSIAVGESDHELSSPTANVGHNTGEICVLGEITWEDL